MLCRRDSCRWRRLLVLAGTLGVIGASRAKAQSPVEPEAFGTVAVEPYGFALYPIASRGVELSVNVTASDAFAMNYAKGEHHQLLMRYDADLVSARYRHYFDGWMRGQLGIGVSQIRQSYDTNLTDGSQVAMLTSRQMLISEASIGHELQLGSFVLACEWLGVVFPISKLAQTQASPEGVNRDEKNENEDAFDRISFVPALQLMRLSFGIVI